MLTFDGIYYILWQHGEVASLLQEIFIKAILNKQDVLGFFSTSIVLKKLLSINIVTLTYTWLHNAPTPQFSKSEDVLILRITCILLTVSKKTPNQVVV